MENHQLRLYYLIYKKIKWRMKSWVKRRKVNILILFKKSGRPIIPQVTGKKMIHIGCGEISSPEFINIDAMPFPHVHYVTDNIKDLSMFKDSSIDLIYMSHVLEHNAIGEVDSVIWEMNRVLKKGGILRISVPDFEKLIKIYYAEGTDIRSINYYLMGNQDHSYNYHRSIYNQNYLSNLMLQMGFSKVLEWDPNNCTYHNFKDESMTKIIGKDGKEYLISLNLEGIK